MTFLFNMNYMVVKINKVFDGSAEKYGWDDGANGLPVQHGVLTRAMTSRSFGIDRMIRFKVKRKRHDLVIDPEVALKLAKKHNAYFTLKTHEGPILYVVIPESACKEVDKVIKTILIFLELDDEKVILR